MGRMMFYVLSAIMITLLLNYSGLTSNTSTLDKFGAGFTYNTTTNSTQIDTSKAPSSSSFWNSIFNNDSGLGLLGILFLGAAGGLFAGLLYGGKLENFIVLGVITGQFAALSGALWSIYMAVSGASPYFAYPVYFLSVVYSVGYFITSIEYFRGNI